MTASTEPSGEMPSGRMSSTTTLASQVIRSPVTWTLLVVTWMCWSASPWSQARSVICIASAPQASWHTKHQFVLCAWRPISRVQTRSIAIPAIVCCASTCSVCLVAIVWTVSLGYTDHQGILPILRERQTELRHPTCIQRSDVQAADDEQSQTGTNCGCERAAETHTAQYGNRMFRSGLNHTHGSSLQ
jgi:hypothetical protein